MKKKLLALVLLSSLSAWAADPTPSDELTFAVERDHASTVLGLLVRGVDPNAADSKGRTPLQVALREDSPQAFDNLMADPRLDIKTPNANGETPLMLAAIKGKLEWVKRLVARGAVINQQGWTPLHYACSGPDEGVSAWLLSQGADINARSPNGTTPLMMASRYGSLTTAENLVKAGADTRLRNEQGLMAIDFARAAGHDRFVKQLAAIKP